MSSGPPPYGQSPPEYDPRKADGSPTGDARRDPGAYGMPAGSAEPSVVTQLGAIASSLGRNVLLALGGALVTVLAFFVLPYVSASVDATTSIVTPVLDAFCGANGCNVSLTAAQALANDGIVLLVPLLALLAAVALVLAVRNALPQTALTPRNGALIAVVAAALGVLLLLNQFLIAASIVEREVEVANALGSVAGVHINAGLGIGFWLMTLGMLAVLAAAILELRRVSSPTAAPSPAGGDDQRLS